MKHKISDIDTRKPDEWPFVLTLKDVGTITEISKAKLLSMASTGELPGVKRVRGRWIITKDNLLQWLNDND